jgi:hypothetical protein
VILFDTTVTPEEIVFSVWTDLRWDKKESRLYFRRHGYAPFEHDFNVVRVGFWPAMEELLFGDATSEDDIRQVRDWLKKGSTELHARGTKLWSRWERVDDKEKLKLWDSFRHKFMDRSTRAREFLKEVNLNTYRELDMRLDALSKWEEEDSEQRKYCSGKPLKSLPMAALERLLGDTPFWKREVERTAYRQGKNDIEQWFFEHGFDATSVITAAAVAWKSEVDSERERQRYHDAVEFAAHHYVETLKPRVGEKLGRHQPSARKAVKEYYPKLKGKEEKQMLDRVRAAVPARVKAILKQKRRPRAL